MQGINNNIPGWNGPEILKVLATHAAKVPKNGAILELGALFGRSTYVLGHNKDETVKLTVIDAWYQLYLGEQDISNFHDNKCSEEEKIRISSKITGNPKRIESDDFFALWKHYTLGIANLEGIKATTDIDNTKFIEYDLIVHDAGHSFDAVYDDLTHWLPKLKKHGSIIVDDYDPNGFSEVVDAVDKIITKYDLFHEMVTDRNILLRYK